MNDWAKEMQWRAGDLRKEYTTSQFYVMETLDMLGIRYATEVPVGSVIVDILVDDGMGGVCIEVDGSHHQTDPEQIEKDVAKDEHLVSEGFRVVRIPNKHANKLRPFTLYDEEDPRRSEGRSAPDWETYQRAADADADALARTPGQSDDFTG
jgi:very-short-patch-repair endonuclease